MTFPSHPYDRITLEELRARQSVKWRFYPEDVLPAWVAEMDYPIADGIKRVLHEAIAHDDAGYADPRGLGDAFASFAGARWGWSVAPEDVLVAPDVVTALCEILLAATREGDGVVIDPPVYFPFGESIQRLGRRVVETPLGSDRHLDFGRIAEAYRSGVKVHILCSPHNPTGAVFDEAELGALADLAARHGVLIVSDEIHAPMTYAENVHHPFPTVSAAARDVAIVLGSASKTWNLAGLKASVIVASGERPRAVVARLSKGLPYHAGHLGVLAARVAFGPEGAAWLDATMTILDRNRRYLAELLAEHLPGVRYALPGASYLAWLDCRDLGLGDEPARAFLAEGKVALSPGLTFGTGGAGFARLNFATTRTLLEEAVTRMTRVVSAARNVVTASREASERRPDEVG